MKNQPIHRTPDPKGRSIRKQSEALPANCRCSMKWVQKLHVPTKTSELTVGIAEGNGEHRSLSPNSSSILSKAFPSNSVHCCVFGPCKQTEHGLFTTMPQQNPSHLSQQQKPTGKRVELYLVYIVDLFDWLTQIRLFFKDKSVSLCN